MSKQIYAISLLLFFCNLSISAQELFPISVNSKYGYINKTGNVAVAPQYDFADKFSEDFAVVKQNHKIGMVIVGEGREESALKLKTTCPPKARVSGDGRRENYQLKTNIIFEPWTNDLPSYYKTADVFLTTSWYEGYGMTLVESAACYTPIVSTDVGIAREVGATIVGWSVAEVAHQILDSLQNPRKSILPHLSTKEEYLKEYSNSLSV